LNSRWTYGSSEDEEHGEIVGLPLAIEGQNRAVTPIDTVQLASNDAIRAYKLELKDKLAAAMRAKLQKRMDADKDSQPEEEEEE